jgi:hypothetical protein
MNYLTKVVLIMMLPLLVKLILLVLVLVATMLTPPTPSHLLWSLLLSSLAVASDEQYESIPDDEIGLLAGKFRAMHKFWKERRRNSRNSQGCFKCYDTTYFITDFPKRKKYDFSNKNDYNNKNNYNNRNEYNNKKDYNNMNDYNNKNDYKKMNRFGDKKKKNIKKIMS